MTDNNVTKLKEQVPAERPNLLQEAIAKGASVDVIERIMGMQERWEANQARKAFFSSIAAFKADPDKPKILKNVEVGFDSNRGGSRTSYKHEDLAEMLEAVDPALAKYGLMARFKSHCDEHSKVHVTCVLAHADGYSVDDNSLAAAPDTSGNKNAVQAIGSTVSYLQRYTLKLALGLAAAKDDDGKRSGAAVLTEQQAEEISKLLKKLPKKDVDKFMELAGLGADETIADMLAIKFDAALAHLKKKVGEK